MQGLIALYLPWNRSKTIALVMDGEPENSFGARTCLFQPFARACPDQA